MSLDIIQKMVYNWFVLVCFISRRMDTNFYLECTAMPLHYWIFGIHRKCSIWSRFIIIGLSKKKKSAYLFSCTSYVADRCARRNAIKLQTQRIDIKSNLILFHFFQLHSFAWDNVTRFFMRAIGIVFAYETFYWRVSSLRWLFQIL